MATLNSALYTLQSSASDRLTGVATRAAGIDVGGELLVMSAFTTTTEIAAESTIYIGILPVGAVVIPALSYVVHGAVGTSVTFDIGDSTLITRYATALDVAAAGTTQFDVNLTTDYAVTATTNTLVATTDGATMDAAIEVLFHVVYKVSR